MIRPLLAHAIVVATLVFSGTAAAETYELEIEGFACQLCARGLQTRLSRLDNVEEVRASFEESRAIARTRDGARLSEEQAREVVEAAGFKLTGYRELPASEHK